MCHYHLLQALKVVVKLKCNQNKQQQKKKPPKPKTKQQADETFRDFFSPIHLTQLLSAHFHVSCAVQKIHVNDAHLSS